MRVDLGCLDVFVTQKLLDGADVVMILQQVGSEGVAERVRRDSFGDAGPCGSLLYSFLHSVFMEVMATNRTTTRVL